MRAAMIVLTSVVLVGCGGVVDDAGLVLGESSVTVTGGTPSADGTKTCFTQTGAIYYDTTGVNPWGTGHGYVIYGGPATFSGGDTVDNNVWLVVGLDTTRTTVVWKLQVEGYANVTPLLNLPGTMPMSCPTDIEPDAGHVGAGNTNTGGGGNCPDGPCRLPTTSYCFPNTMITETQTSCTCSDSASSACKNANYSCGSTRDRCGNTVSCGVCPWGSTCSAGACNVKIPTCPKGTHYCGADEGCRGACY